MVIANTKLLGILFIVDMHNAVVYAVTAYSFVMNNLTFKNQMCRPPSCPSTSPSLISQGDLITSCFSWFYSVPSNWTLQFMDSLAAAGGIVVWMASERRLPRCENGKTSFLISAQVVCCRITSSWHGSLSLGAVDAV